MADPTQIDQLLRKLDAQRDAYFAAFQKAHDLLAKDLASAAAATAISPVPRGSISVPRPLQREQSSSRPSFAHSASDTTRRKSLSALDTLVASSASRGTGEDSDEDEDENLYASQPLQPQTYDHEGLRDHLQSHKWTDGGRTILDGIVNNHTRMLQPTLFPTNAGKTEDRSHFSHHQVFDVGPDGAPLPVELPESERGPSNAIRIWNTLREVNSPFKAHSTVGRITIIREPSPILFAAIHFTHHEFFDVDQIFDKLVEPGFSSASFYGSFHDDERRQRSFVFNLEYFTIIGKDCKPMHWQMADRQRASGSYHIPISRCSSVVALSLAGKPIKKVKNHSRRAMSRYGYLYDPFAPWNVLNIQCNPDWKASTDVHDSTKHYVNGVEAFLVTLLGEFRDAQDRFEGIYREVTKLITPPQTFMFDLDVRDRLQFEDEHYTYSRRYFWAYQTLGIMNDSMKAIVDTFEDTFTDDVWEGRHRTIWPLLEEGSARNVYYTKKMAGLRKKFDVEMHNFRTLMRENHERRLEIRGLREELFTGTSIQESRLSVKNTEITIQQGHNIKLLTLVSMCFLPLTFVTSVFGMTNMPEEHTYWEFGLVTGTVCIPFFILIGSLNTTKGMHFWRRKTKALFKTMVLFFTWVATLGKFGNHPPAEDGEDNESDSPRTSVNIEREVTMDSTAMRLRRWSSNQKGELATQERQVETQDESDAGKPAVEKPSTSTIALMWGEERKRTTALDRQEV